MRFALLGVLEVKDTDRPLDLGRGKQRALLAVLLLHANESVANDELVDALWPSGLPVHARKSLQVAVSRLRALIGPDRLSTTPEGYMLRVDAGELDVVEFERLTSDARERVEAGDARGGHAAFVAALELWRGPALAEFRYSSFAQEPARHLEEARATVRADLVDVRIGLGREGEVLSELEALISEHPYWERLRHSQMLALYRAGRQVDALRVFRETRRLLSDDLALEPGPELQRLEREILSQDPAIARPGRSRTPAVSRRAGTLSLLVGMAALAGALLVLGFGVGKHGSTRTHVAADSIAVLDARSGHVIADIPNGMRLGALTGRPGTLWVANGDENSVSLVDLTTGAVRQSIIVGEEPDAITTGKGAVWVANSRGGTVSRINPTARRVVQNGIRVGNGPAGIAYGDGAVWVANAVDGTVSRIDALTGKTTNTWPAVVGPTALIYAFGLVWVASGTSGEVVALQPGSGTIVGRVNVGVDPDAIASGNGAIWVANRADGTVWKIEPGPPPHLARAIPVGPAPVALSIASSGVWVATSGNDSIEQLAPAGYPILHVIRLAAPPQGIDALGGHVYVTVGSSERAHRGGTLRVLGSPPDSLNPARAYASEAWDVLASTNDGLVDFRRTGGTDGIELEPDLATALPVASDGRTYTFELRVGIRYSTGQLVQAQDIKTGIERVFEATPPSPGRQYYKQIIGINRCRPGRRCDLSQGIVTSVGSRTITFHLRAPDPDFLTELAIPFADAVPATAAAGQRVPATGPYMIASYRKSVSLRLIRNPLFRQWSPDAQPNGYPNVIAWRFRKDDLDTWPLAKQVERHQADVVPRLLPPPLTKLQLGTLSIRYPSQLHFNTTQETNFFFLNTRVPPFNNLRIRQAVNHALNRGAFVRELGPGYSATCEIVPPDFPGYRQYCRPGTGGTAAIESARRIVRSAGAVGTHVTVWVIAALAQQGRSMVVLLDDLGFKATVKPIAPIPNVGASYFRAIFNPRTRAQVGFYAWSADFPSETGFMQQFLSCTAFAHGNPYLNDDPSEFCDPAVDRLFTRATNAMTDNPSAASALWQKAERTILAEAPFVPTYNPENVAFLAPNVGNFQYNPQYGVLLDQLWVH